MKTYIPKNTEVFFVSASDFILADESTWQFTLYRTKLESDPDNEMNETARAYEGWYWWTCCPGCLPDSEASGPFESEAEAIQDAGGGEYEDYIIALAEELGCEPSEIEEERHDYYGLKVLSYGREEYAIGTDEEAEEAWDQALDSYLDDCGVLDSIPENLRRYFDRDAWKREARYDGRGHALAGYDGDEMKLSDGFVAFRIN